LYFLQKIYTSFYVSNDLAAFESKLVFQKIGRAHV